MGSGGSNPKNFLGGQGEGVGGGGQGWIFAATTQ